LNDIKLGLAKSEMSYLANLVALHQDPRPVQSRSPVALPCFPAPLGAILHVPQCPRDRRRGRRSAPWCDLLSARRSSLASQAAAHLRLRSYRYDVGQAFRWPYDGALRRSPVEQSRLTLMVYATARVASRSTIKKTASAAA